MASLIHIRVGKELKKNMQKLIDRGLFSNQAEIAREGLRGILLKYSDIDKKIKNGKKNLNK